MHWGLTAFGGSRPLASGWCSARSGRGAEPRGGGCPSDFNLDRGSARVAARLLLTLRGTPTIYQGEEIGMTDSPIASPLVHDPWEKNVPGLAWAEITGCAKTAELINRRAYRREAECLKWFREHLIEIGLGSDTNCNVRIELLAGCDCSEISHILD